MYTCVTLHEQIKDAKVKTTAQNRLLLYKTSPIAQQTMQLHSYIMMQSWHNEAQ